MTTSPLPGTNGTAPDQASGRVLLVCPGVGDGDPIARELRGEGYLVRTVGDPGEAVARLRGDAFDLVLLDGSLPGREGHRFLEALRGDLEIGHVPVIVVSDADDLDRLTELLELGADDYLPRAFRPAMLRTRLGTALHRQRLRDAEDLEREMAVARNIQRDFLPEALPMTMGLKLEAVLQPARQVSGDFYDAFILTQSGSVVLVVGDVCDKGVGAALFMALFRSLIRASADPVGGGAIQMIGGRRTLVRQSLEAASPADLLTRVAGFTNDYIARLHGRTNMFATVFMAVLSPATGQFDYVNCGHEPAIVLAPDGSILELRPTGPALGMETDQLFRAGEGQLGRDHCLLAFTDGLKEARSPSGEVFGMARLVETLRANTTNPSQLVQGVLDALNTFGGNAEPHDDLTLLAATRTIG